MVYNLSQALRLATPLLLPSRTAGLRKPLRPSLNPFDPINDNLRSCWIFGDKFQNPVTMLNFPGEFTNGANSMNMINFASNSIKPNDRGGQSLRFATNTRIDWGVGYFAALTYPYSIRCRFKPATLAAAVYNLAYEQSSGQNGMNWVANQGSGTSMIYQINSGAANNQLNSVRTSWTTTDFIDAIFVMEANNTGRLYLDGVLDNSLASMPAPLAAVDNTQWGCVHFSGGSTQSFFNGDMDIAQLWRGRALSLADAQRLKAEPYAGLLDIPASIPIRRGVPKHVAGTITEGGTPVAKLVAAFDPVTLALIGSTTSSGVDGTYSIPVGSRGSVFVVAFDPTTYQAQIYDNVTSVA